MSRLPTRAPDPSVIPEDIPYLALPDSSRGWIAPNYGELDKQHLVTLARMLAAQKDDQQCQDRQDGPERHRIAARRRAAMLKLFRATDPFASLSIDLLEPLT